MGFDSFPKFGIGSSLNTILLPPLLIDVRTIMH
jgi:hypothetical protein